MQAVDSRLEVPPGERYRLGEVIGRGGLGDVYEAEDTELCRRVAVKRLHGLEAGAEESAARILQEARNLAALQHPNIVTVYDVIARRGDVVVVMELLQGKTLQELAEKAPLSIEDFGEVMEQSLQGLIAAHARGMLHRDIKPSNLMLSRLPDGEAQLKILDFGMAKIAPGPSEQTKDEEGALMGSIYMMSPEQLEGRPLDVRSDLYSLGCVAYFALTACYPFSGKTVAEVIAAHLQGRRTPLETLRPDLPKPLCAWVDRLMAIRPDDRPSTAVSALAQLRGVLDPVPAAPVVVSLSPMRPVAERVPRNWRIPLPRIRFADLGVAGLLVAICAVCYFWLGLPGKKTVAAAIPTVAATERQAVLAHLGKPVILEGVVRDVAPGASRGFRFLRFEGTGDNDIALAFFSAESPVELVRKMSGFVGRKVRVSGTVGQQDNRPLIFVDSFSQLETL